LCTPELALTELILVVDDDPKIVALLRAYLVRAGYDVATATDGRRALDAIRTRRPQLVVLDLMLPEVDGLEVARLARLESQVPILMLTARGSVAQRVEGLRIGADDYLVKPFAPDELVARVQAILRRSPPETDQLRHLDLVVDTLRHEVTRNGERINLTALEFKLLVAIVGARGRVLARDQLMDAIAGHEAEGVLERSLDVYVARLRAKLGDDAARPRHIRTERGVGYRLAPAD
jgi:DNA-binding response OmpR family regulator